MHGRSGVGRQSEPTIRRRPKSLRPRSRESDKPVNRRTHLFGIRISATATVLAALLSGIVGGVGGSVLTADRTDARSQNEFLQTQRISLYGEFLAQVDTSMGLMADYVPSVHNETGTAYLDLPAPSSEQYQQMEEASQQLSTLWGRVRILSGSDAGFQAHMLQGQVQSMFNFVYNVDACHKDPEHGSDLPQILPFGNSDPEPYCTRKNDPWPEGIDPFIKRQDFLLAVRQELGIPD